METTPASMRRLSTLFEEYDSDVGQHELGMRRRHFGCGMINPSGVFRVGWDLFITCFILYVLLSEPLSMGFWDERMLRPGTVLGIVNRTMDGVFVVDLFLNFRFKTFFSASRNEASGTLHGRSSF